MHYAMVHTLHEKVARPSACAARFDANSVAGNTSRYLSFQLVEKGMMTVLSCVVLGRG